MRTLYGNDKPIVEKADNCSVCDCRFAYTEDDIEEVIGKRDSKFVTCPHCGYEIYI